MGNRFRAQSVFGLAFVAIVLLLSSSVVSFALSLSDNPIPSVTTLNPPAIKAGSGSFTLVVNGANFVTNSVVRWAGANKPTTYISPTRLSATIASADITTTKTVSITVFNPTPGGGVSNGVNFEVNNKNNTTTTIVTHTPNPSATGQAVTVTYSVTSTTGTPTGTVTVSDGTINCIGTLPATSCPLTFSSAGDKVLTATYSGDGSFNGSVSADVLHVVFGPLYMPLVAKQPTVTPTPTSTPTPTRTSTVTPTPTATPIPNPFKNGNFESGHDGSWYEDPTGVLITNNLQGKTAHSGTWAAWLGDRPGGGFSRTDTVSQQVTIPAGGSVLAFWFWIDSQDECGYDEAWVYVETTIVDHFNLCAPNNTNGWQKRTVDLSAYVGQTRWIQFIARTDSAYASAFFVDDVAMGTLPPAPARGQTPAPTGTPVPIRR